MAVGIVSAMDQGAFWRSAADAPTSEPPSGASSDSAGQDVTIPNSNKFKTPANGLKKLLDSIDSSTNDKAFYGPAAHPKLKDWLETHPAFTKPYFKPQYQDALKAYLGKDNYEKLMYHAPSAHSMALNHYTQQPAPNSNKFKTPANGLKKLLDTNPSSDQVKQWVSEHPAFHTYLGPEYEDALKGHLGEVNHAKFKIHTTSGGSSTPASSPKVEPVAQPAPTAGPPPKVDVELPSKGLGQKLKEVGVNPSPGAQQAWDNATPEHMLNTVLPNLKKHHPPETTDKVEQIIHDHFGTQSAQPEPAAEANSPHYDALKQKASKGYVSDVPKIIESPAFHQWFHSHSKEQQEALSQVPGATSAKFKKWLVKHPEADNAVPTPDKQDQPEVKPPEPEVAAPENPHSPDMGLGTGGQAAYDEIKKVFPQSGLDPNSSSEEIKSQLESWLKYLPDHPGFKQHVPQLQKIYDQYFSGKAPGPSAPTPEQSPEPSDSKLDADGVQDKLNQIYPGWLNQPGWFSKMSPEEQKNTFNMWLLNTALSPSQAQQFKKVYDDYFGDEQAAVSKPEQTFGQMAADVFPDVFGSSMAKKFDGYSPEKQKALLKNWIDNEQGKKDGGFDKLKAFYDQHFGEPKAETSPTPGGGISLDLQGLQKDYKAIWGGNASGLDPYLKKNSPPEEIESFLKHQIDSWGQDDDPDSKAKTQAIQQLYDKYFGKKPESESVDSKTKQPIDLSALASEYGQVHGLTKDHKLNDVGQASTPEEAEAALKSNLQGWQHAANEKDGEWAKPKADKLQQIYDKYFGGESGDSTPQPPPTWDPQQFANEYNAILPNSGSSVGQGGATSEKAQSKLQQLIDDHPGTETTNQLQQLKDKWFGGGDAPSPVASPAPAPKWDASTPLGDAVKKAFPGLVGGNVKSFNENPQDKKSLLKQIIDNDAWGKSSYGDQGADNQQLKEIYDTYFGNEYGTGSGQSVQPHVEEPEEDEGVSAPFKGNEVHPDDLAKWTGAKPQNAADWKAFSNWWGATKVSPEQEQQIYHSWFPKKNATPEQANSWFSKVYDFHSKPGSGDLGQTDMPAWAGNSWAFGDKAAKEWPVFKVWAATAPGIPPNTSIKQKLQIWNSLSAGDKKEIEGNYVPKNPVDAKGVVAALKKAYPDSDWSSWDTMPQGTLAQNVENLAKAGYKGAVSVYNDVYGGKLPMPKEQEKKPQGFPEPPQVPPANLPDWWKSNYGSSADQAKKFSGFAHWAKLIGKEDAVKTGGQDLYTSNGTSIHTMWNQTPEWLKKQIGAMGSTAPFKTPEEYQEWLGKQDTPWTDLQKIHPEKYGEGVPVSSYMKNMLSANPTGYKFAHQTKQFGSMIESEQDPEKKKQLLDAYHKFYGSKETLEQALEKTFPVPPKGVKATSWNEFLSNNSTEQVGATVKKLMKAEKDPEKFIQLVDLWGKYIGGLSGVGAVTNTLGKNYSAGSPVSSSSLKQLHKWKQNGGPPSSPVPSYWNVDDVDSNYIKNKMAMGDDSGYYAPYHGLTPKVITSAGKADPAMLGSNHEPNYSAPEQAKGKAYSELMSTVSKHDAAYSGNDKKLLDSEEFRSWFESQASSYKKTFSFHPGIAIDDYKSFMEGNPNDPEVPESDGTKKVYDVSPFANVPKAKGVQNLKKVFGPQYKPPNAKDPYSNNDYSPVHFNPQRSDTIKFPQEQDAQDTIPLGPNQQFAPKYDAMPIYRVMRIKPNQETGDPVRDKVLKQIRDILWGQKPQDKPASPTLFDNEPAQTWPKDAPPIPQTADQWMEVMDWAKKNSLSSEQMYDLAEKAGATPGKFGQPPLANQAPNYDDPRLAPLLLDFLEKSHDPKSGGLGVHWTRSRQKGYEGVPSAGSDATTTSPTKDSIPVLVSGLWGGQGEDTTDRGGVYAPLSPSELEHHLLPHAPVHVRRLQIKSPDSDWHDLMDYGPISMWPEGRDEQTKDKPSLQAELAKVGVPVDAEFDKFKPGPHTDQAFDKLVQKFPNKQKELDKVYQHFFVGRPDLPTKPHTRYATIKAMPRLASMEHSIAILSATEEPPMERLSDYERRIEALFHDEEDPLAKLYHSEYDESHHPHGTVTESPNELIYGAWHPHLPKAEPYSRSPVSVMHQDSDDDADDPFIHDYDPDVTSNHYDPHEYQQDDQL